MNELREPNWHADAAILIEEGKRAIERFSVSHPQDVCSSFAFSVDYCFGNVALCIDTEENSLIHAKRHEVQILKSRDAMLLRELGWENARYYLQRETICTFNAHTANFKYAAYGELHFPDWEAYFLNDKRPEQPDPEGHVIVLFYKAISELVSIGSFDRLTMSSPFRVGVEFPEDLGLVVMRVLNWPSPK